MVISKEKYNQWIEQPNLIGQDELNQLQEILQLYPYCSSTHLLYLKSLSNTNSIFFNHQLKICAANSGDRNRLFDLITEKNKTKISPKAKSTKKEKNTVSKSIEQKLEIGSPIKFKAEERHSFDQWLKLSVAKPIKKPNNKLENQINLIEKFIEKNPRIEANKEAFYSPSVQAKKSIKENPDFITETLAKVYLEQGAYSKAKLN